MSCRISCRLRLNLIEYVKVIIEQIPQEIDHGGIGMRIVTLDFSASEKIDIIEYRLNCEPCNEKPCCKKFKVPLTPAESMRLKVDEEAWKDKIAILAKKEDGSCYYLLENGRCSVWETRPAACREYSCLNDMRIKK